jgi:hypothetical protein
MYLFWCLLLCAPSVAPFYGEVAVACLLSCAPSVAPFYGEITVACLLSCAPSVAPFYGEVTVASVLVPNYELKFTPQNHEQHNQFLRLPADFTPDESSRFFGRIKGFKRELLTVEDWEAISSQCPAKCGSTPHPGKGCKIRLTRQQQREHKRQILREKRTKYQLNRGSQKKGGSKSVAVLESCKASHLERGNYGFKGFWSEAIMRFSRQIKQQTAG